jgi:peptidoglycan/LPS O-acetylase OafA/YrhL
VTVIDRPLQARTAPPGPPAPRFGHVAALDGLRGLAVLLVVVYHFAPDVLPAGFIGVDLFFVLSGFLIASLALGEHAETSRLSARGFFGRRARRLLPAAVAAVVAIVLVGAIVQPASNRPTLRGQSIASLFYVNNWWAILQGESYQAAFGTESPLSHFWSLAVEEQFYLLFPLLVLALVAVVRWRRGTTRGLAWTLLAVAGVGALASASWMAVLHDPTQEPSRVYFGTDTRIQAILVGVGGACAWHLWSHRLRRTASSRLLAVLGVAAVGFLVYVAAEAKLRDNWLYDYGFLAIAAATLVAILAVCASRSPVSRAFEMRWLCILGLASYSIYLWHWPVKVFLTSDNTSLHGWGLFGARVVVTAAAATVSFLAIERPFRSARRLPVIAMTSIAGIAMAVAAVWIVARPVPPAAAAYTTEVAPTVETTPAAPLPPLRVLWLGDSVGWTLGGGHFDFPDPVGFDNPFDATKIAIWNKASWGCPLVDTPRRSFGVTKELQGWCLHRDEEWPKLMDQFPADVVSWSSSFYDTWDEKVGGRWLDFGTPEWDAVYLANLEDARSVATSRGAAFLLVAQADPIADPSQKEMENLLPQNIWRYGHLRDLQKQFAATHPTDTHVVDLQPIVCPNDSCAGMTLDAPGLRADGVHFWKDKANSVAPLGPQIQAAILTSLGRSG